MLIQINTNIVATAQDLILLILKCLRYLNSCEGPTQELDDAILTAEAKYPINFKQTGFLLSLHYNGINSLLFVNTTKIYRFSAKGSEIKDYTLILGNISKDFTVNNMKKYRIKRNCKTFFC